MEQIYYILMKCWRNLLDGGYDGKNEKESDQGNFSHTQDKGGKTDTKM